MLRLLITGGAGFIGSNLARLAVSAKHDVTVIDDLSTGDETNLDFLKVNFVRGSILDEPALQIAFEGVHSVVHLAALGSVPRSIENPTATHEANASGTLAVLECARAAGVKHVVVASSSSVYGSNLAMPKSEREWIRPLSPYAVTKVATEQYALAYQQAFGFRSVAFRFFNVYGPRQKAGHVYAAVVPVLIDAILRGLPLPINGDGYNSRDFTYVGTVCRVLLNTVERQLSHPEPINLAFGTNTTLLDLVEEIQTASGLPARVDHRPERIGDVKHSRADNATLRSLFPDIESVPLQIGLTQTIAWFKEIGL